jgi:hypothetical protein
MSVRELAESDLAETLEDADGAGSPFTLIDPTNTEYPLTGTFGDIGYLLDSETGLPVQGRTITATYRMKSLFEKTIYPPGRGWRVKVNGLDGAEHIFHVVNYEPDRTIGIGRLKLGAGDGK